MRGRKTPKLVNAVVAGNSKKDHTNGRQVYGDQVRVLPNEGFAVTAWALPYAVAMIAFVVILLLGLDRFEAIYGHRNDRTSRRNRSCRTKTMRPERSSSAN